MVKFRITTKSSGFFGDFYETAKNSPCFNDVKWKLRGSGY
jgi:hypothetical protein